MASSEKLVITAAATSVRPATLSLHRRNWYRLNQSNRLWFHLSLRGQHSIAIVEQLRLWLWTADLTQCGFWLVNQNSSWLATRSWTCLHSIQGSLIRDAGYNLHRILGTVTVKGLKYFLLRIAYIVHSFFFIYLSPFRIQDCMTHMRIKINFCIAACFSQHVQKVFS